ncbi:MAG: phosphoribosyltransferase [Candidatus Bathyarchaeota archaeon]|nr:phosphoribosyltransferase [Candidatus Bathyarchaeum tardum]WGM90323.1 MAG: phosphoribosyltransferase [Candidatus Bathyarchaeum tardum]
MDEKTFECLVMDWDMFYRLAKKVADKINKSGYQPEVIVGLARGGWVLARVLCDFVGVKDLVSLKVEHWGVTATPDGTAKIRNEIRADLKGKNVLIVDDLTDTGESMRVAVDYIKSLEPAEIRTASLQHLTCAKFKSDYVGEELPWVWVIFPWNFTEDLCTIIPKVCRRMKATPEEADVTQIKDELKQSYCIDTTEETINEILQEIKRRKN